MNSDTAEVNGTSANFAKTLEKNDVPSGYAWSSVSELPEDWDIKTLADICIPQGIVRGPFGGTLKKEMFVASGFKVYEQQNVIHKNYEIGSYFIDQTKYAAMHRFSISTNDFIVSCSGTIGRIFQIPPDAPPGVINQALLKLTTNKDVVDARYFYILFQWDGFQLKVIESTQGGAMKNLVGMDVFKTTLILLPPLPEQRVIADVLSDVDELLVVLEALIAKKLNIKQATMQQLLTGKTRLQGFSGEWETKKLRNLLIYEHPDRYIVKCTNYLEYGDIPVITANKTFILGHTNENFGICDDLPVIVFDDFTTNCKYMTNRFKVKSSAIKLLRAKYDDVDRKRSVVP